ncbi:MAG: glycosyltransferase family 39 protein [Pseudomonadota bacterium]
MAASEMNREASAVRPLIASFWFWVGAITVVRILLLPIADGGLGPDEAQYWYWAQSFDFGYFSKPPMIAWIIAAFTGLFGDAAWAVRLPAPLLQAGAGVFVYLTAKRLFSPQIAFWAGLGWLTLPGVILSSSLITTDGPLLLFWSGAFYCLVRIIDGDQHKPTDFAALGAMIGLGLLSKYAMTYFIAALAITLVTSQTARRAFAQPQAAIAAGIAIALISPNLIWNIQHDFQTVAHTAANANWGSDLFKPGKLAGFAISQFAVFGIIPFAVLAAVVFMTARGAAFLNATGAAQRMLLIFALTPLFIVSMQAFISRAHANWAATAYPAAIILVTALLMRNGKAWLAKLNVGLHALGMTVFTIAMTNFSLLDRLGAGRAVAELRGWETMTAAIAAEAAPGDVILFDDRSMIAEMLYHQRDQNLNIATLDPNAGVHHHYEAVLPFDARFHEEALFVSILPTDAHVNYRFRTIIPRGFVSGDLGVGEQRTFYLFDLDDYYGPNDKK